ncbi:GyrI-like domain-containing protein [Halalkalibacterium halodurans]|jgi:predicted transcriptional regulator YdeE|uniref:DNA-binding protein n=1 Tax=Halalkalibacterium halodurans TaxID=86665 RepID=A0A0M0KC81_ALKHA|nr:GyrI-like domain-containing protein [Halalkalibacterium halodurans]MDY7221166.1 GyrI-like domain-containing protein [Halalkalibacterium halodurans]MDY7240405.1 GyrI-like domain-containing protein [Halalkalibacterium halodurans]MED3647805.1 GyrI-like domain-containing protein [Halalkalibacterium halodurans]TES50065.1 AraC family transcriptional regulator [Halalkalibacterium halodurans]TPE70016.1 AraC family transcriptional regulator [Halalkalibacterium halodurans]
MTKEQAVLSGFSFIGRTARTTNEAEMKGEGVISSQWDAFYKEPFVDRIPQQKEEAIIALYTDYESDETGEYTFAIGAKVQDEAEAPEGLSKVTVPEATYVKFTSRKGPMDQVVMEAWQEIWEWSKANPNKRAFIADFEVYDERAQDPQNGQVDIYISVV